jgi:YVTN family beta-propeller protein
MQTSSAVVFISLPSGTISGTSPLAVGDTPWGVDITPDGTRAIVVNVNDDSVSIIDLASQIVTATIVLPVGSNPNFVSISPDGLTAYVDTHLTNTLQVLDLASLTLGTPIPVGASPQFVKISPNGKTIYTTNINDNTLSVITFAAAAAAPALASTGVDAARESALAAGGTALVLLGIVIVLARRRLDALQT